MLKVDFHVHTSCSDGTLSPKEVIQRANKNNVKCLSITDHDTLSGLTDAIDEALNYDITLIPGIELSTQHNDESIHILGFFKDNSFKNEELIEELNKIKNHRILRAKSIVNKLKEEFNIEISFEKILKDSKDTVARPHIARAIINSGYPYTFEEIFDNFIGKGCKAYVPTLKLSTLEGVKLLKKYNALVFLAHPKLISKSNLTEFLSMSFDGIEGIYCQNTIKETINFLKFADENNLLVSCGSDFHGNIESDTRHGDIGSMELPSKYFLNLLDALGINSYR
ncbi:PHP domain-containing protein [Clostridium saccharobutylicum]|uniref:Protein TrpH n=1 Tax=Clostridium saccharobutylicum DSM 13864 TaxID=1345695 RepID=U5MTC9_CLOSA|nr:PHP domain-containing protein [Clostridium saccharobutylicum]AGX44029.1 protein TrpH [Clostridium saccharobutylicum DSM 13864]AQR91321.1 DNA polymerase III PolC-type [Clostridium saccharobutylicum]AQS01225.1 DNA polymerase III PolC-type [Clostridium saccharobutylicum]AQS10834.1 DNA polymerase III PolC-type [Clostridium saccharobutylicum]AQS15208.1 DNA polymerase III PolC-type [Clostridium saccharobutylicum]